MVQNISKTQLKVVFHLFGAIPLQRHWVDSFGDLAFLDMISWKKKINTVGLDGLDLWVG